MMAFAFVSVSEASVKRSAVGSSATQSARIVAEHVAADSLLQQSFGLNEVLPVTTLGKPVNELQVVKVFQKLCKAKLSNFVFSPHIWCFQYFSVVLDFSTEHLGF